MADEVEMTPVEGAEPPKVNPLGRPSTIKLAPIARNPVPGAAPSPALKPGLKLPTKPGLKLPTQTALKPGLKLPPKPGLKLPTQTALKPGLKLPPKPGLKLPTQTALKPGVKLPQKPVIRKPGATVNAAPLPKPVAPISVDVQGVGKLPTVSSTAVSRGDSAPVVEPPKPMEALKSVTQKLKGITQEIPQQAVLHKTGIIAEGGMSESQKEAAKHKTARISLSDAMGVAPVKDEAAPMKTIRIKRPVNIPTPAPTSTLTPQPKEEAPAAPAAEAAAKPEASESATLKITRPTVAGTPAPAAAPAATVTQRKTLKITRPGATAVRPGGKFGIKRPSQATTIAKPASTEPAAAAAPAGGEVAEIPDIPSTVPALPTATPAAEAGPAWLWTMSALLQLAACIVIGALAWFLYENTQTMYF